MLFLNNKKVVCIIPARQGSQGIKDKNIIDFNGKPLMAYTIEEAKKSEYIDKVFVTTDSKKYSSIALKFGAECPFLRGKILSDRNTHAVYPVLDYLEKLENIKKYNADIVVMLLPTSPLRKVKHIDGAISEFLKHDDMGISVISVTSGKHPRNAQRLKKGRLIQYLNKDYDNPNFQRQELDNVYYPNGSIYITSVKALKEHRTFYLEKIYPFFMKEEFSVDINTWFDLRVASCIKEGNDYLGI